MRIKKCIFSLIISLGSFTSVISQSTCIDFSNAQIDHLNLATKALQLFDLKVLPDTLSNKKGQLFKFIINSGISFNNFETIERDFNLQKCIGFNLSPVFQVQLLDALYSGIEIGVIATPTKVGFQGSETLEAYDEDISGMIYPFSINKNARASYVSVAVMPKIGISHRFSGTDVGIPDILIGTELFLEFCCGIGGAWYKIDPFVTGARNDYVMTVDYLRDKIQSAVMKSESLNQLDSEWIFSTTLKYGLEFKKKIRLAFSWNSTTGLEYSKFYPGSWIGYSVQYWSPPTTRRMNRNSVMIEIGYRIN